MTGIFFSLFFNQYTLFFFITDDTFQDGSTCGENEDESDSSSKKEVI